MKKKVLLSVFLVLAVLLFTGCAGEPEPLRVCEERKTISKRSNIHISFLMLRVFHMETFIYITLGS